MDTYFKILLYFSPFHRFILLIVTGYVLLTDVVVLWSGSVSLFGGAVRIGQHTVGFLLILVAVIIFLKSAWNCLDPDWSKVISGRYSAGVRYDADTLETVRRSVGHPKMWKKDDIISPDICEMHYWRECRDKVHGLISLPFDQVCGTELFFTEFDSLKTKLVLYLRINKLAGRWQEYKLSGSGKIVDEMRGIIANSLIEIDSDHPCSTISISGLRDLLYYYWKGLPIVLPVRQYCKPVGAEAVYYVFIYFRVRFFSFITSQRLVSLGLGYLQEADNKKVLSGALVDVSLEE